MEGNHKLSFSIMTEQDIELLSPIMTRAFDEDTKIHLGKDKGGPPGYDNGEFLRKWGLHADSSAFNIYYKGNLIGAITLWIKDDGNNYLGNIFLDPEFENKGIGTEIWKLVEKNYSNTKKWITDTPGFSKRNHNYYINKCGFKLVEIKDQGGFDLYILEKEMSN
ncbi:GNAT family N-acetyltransferase [Haloplasma contractile]|uniref:Phospholipiddiacylglycerol acyltransferase protein n=1 Tax=Haloplasma contractile SSD-17B TaxID=1033810 RepID=U2DY91_9MOLU|nr:GNAT family N-acetyltransferase [Haloplasma contractile]ERJ13227.1 phospholipiddiacylglycerol acyltransferase protein [Haloplasma contractile SSD-17B]